MLSDTGVFESTVEYYRLEFTEQKTQAQHYFTIITLLVLAHCAITTTITIKTLTRKQRKTHV